MEVMFTDGDIKRLAHSPTEAVRLRAMGWREVEPEAEPEPEEKPKSTTK